MRGVSGRTHAAGTTIRYRGRGEVVDAWIEGDWVPLRWWEFALGDAEHPPGESR